MKRNIGKVTQLSLLVGVLVAMSSCSDFSSRIPDSNASRLLPEAPPQWQQAGGTKSFAGVALSDYINGGSEAYYAYGFREVAVRDFENDSGARLTVEIYEMSKPENAYGIFSTDSAGERWPIGADASYGGGLLRFWKGRYFVRILCYPPDPSIEAVIKETGTKIADAVEGESWRPELFLSLLPETDVVPDSVCYFHRQTSLNNIRFLSDENLLHIGDGVDAITWEEPVSATATAKPNEAAGALRQIALRYPSDDEAKAAFEDFTRKYLKVGKSGAEGSAAFVTAELKDKKHATAGRRSAWVVVVIDAPSAETAAEAAGRSLAKVGAAQRAEGS